MTLIEQKARPGPLPCRTCGGQAACGFVVRAACPAIRRYVNYRRAAYRAHLRWMERAARWKGARG